MGGKSWSRGQVAARGSAAGILAAVVAMGLMSSADAGSKTKVLGPTKTVVEDDTVGSGSGTDQTTIATCPKGFKATGGGIDFVSSDPSVSVPYNGPLVKNDNLVAAGEGTFGGGRKWRVRVENEGVGSYDYSVGVVCAKIVKIAG